MKQITTYTAKAGKLVRRPAPTPVPDPTPTPTPTPTPGVTIDAGSLPVGTANYPVPAGALFVDPSAGSDTAAGTLDAPLRTFEKATQVVPANGTIVLRAGVYHEGKTRATGGVQGYVGVPITTAGVTVQNYPGEAVWFDGATTVTGFTADAGYWSRAWTPFRRDPQYAWYGGTYPPANNNWPIMDDQRPDWQFVDYVNAPCAAWPERLWIDGVAQQQVDLLSKMSAGKFYIDAYTNKLYIGENPAGKKVELTDLQTCMNALASNVTFRGFGVRRYAGSNPQGAAVKAHRPNARVENMVFEDISAQGLGFVGTSGNVGAHDSVVSRVTVRRCGNLGVASTQCDRLVIDRLVAEYCNDKRFNYAPSAGGVKVTFFRKITFNQCIFRNNYGKGLWFDEDCDDITIINCDFTGNEQRDLVFELTGKVFVANTRFLDSGNDGLVSINSERLEVWNCTFLGQGRLRDKIVGGTAPRQASIKPDERLPRNTAPYGRDTRAAAGTIPPWPTPDPMGWIPRKVMFRNCVFGHANVQAIFGDEDFRKNAKNADGSGQAESWRTIGIDLDHNVYNRNPAITMQYPWLLSRVGPPAGQPAQDIYASLTALRTGTGLETHALYVNGASVLDANGMPLASQKASVDAAATPIPDYVAALVGQPTGVIHAGAWR